MSTQGKRGGNKHGCHRDFNENLGDITLADYANSSNSSGKRRIRKAKTFNMVREVKQLNIEEKTWDEKVDEFEGDYDFVKEENEDGEVVVVMKKTSCRRKKTLIESIAQKCTGGNTYPLDIWHLIANYIRPEDIATFSAICKDSWSVTNTPSFWLNLYKRHYKDVPNLPPRLKPECMVRHHGLKACVVRSLFYMYTPFVTRVDASSMGTPYDLKSRQCIFMWQERYSNKWRLSFKLRHKDFQPNPSHKGEELGLMEILDDIFANADDGCTVLQVVSSEKSAVPVVMGLTLHSINISLDMTMAHMSLTLVFGSGRICNGKLDCVGAVTLALKTVTQVSVLDWWHPRYPHASPYIRLACDT